MFFPIVFSGNPRGPRGRVRNHAMRDLDSLVHALMRMRGVSGAAKPPPSGFVTA
jgi:hypothetical protein